MTLTWSRASCCPCFSPASPCLPLKLQAEWMNKQAQSLMSCISSALMCFLYLILYSCRYSCSNIIKQSLILLRGNYQRTQPAWLGFPKWLSTLQTQSQKTDLHAMPLSAYPQLSCSIWHQRHPYLLNKARTCLAHASLQNHTQLF